MRVAPGFAAVMLTTLVAATGCSGSNQSKAPSPSAGQSPGASGLAAPAVASCLKMTSVSNLTQATSIDCAKPHQGQVFAIISLPAAITDPAVRKQVTDAKASLACPSVKAWSGYTGTIPLGLFRTWRFPAKQQIVAGAHWTACVAILAPGPDHDTLKATVGTLAGKLTGVTNPLPLLGQCAPSHTNTAFTPITCVPGSTQWVWLGAHRKPAGAYPGSAQAKKTAHDGCTGLVKKEGGGGARVYYPTTAQAWAAAPADWSCWMPIARVKK